jgi:hypothetical protein
MSTDAESQPNKAKQLAAAVLAYYEVVFREAAAAGEGTRTVQGEDLDAAAERQFLIACDILEVDPLHALDRVRGHDPALMELLRGFAAPQD